MNHKLPQSMPKQSIGDVIDKLSTLTRKVYFGEEDAIEELNYLISHLDKIDLHKHSKRLGKFVVTVIRLSQINFEVWNRENAFRRGESLSSDAVKKIAIEVRDLNERRVHYKNELNKLTGLGFREFKVRHRSR